MPVHAFADESIRRDTYFITAALIETTELHRLRKEPRGLLLPGQRELHLNREKDARRRHVVARVGIPDDG